MSFQVREGRRGRPHAGRHRNGDGQHVVGHQRAGGHQGGQRAKVISRHPVRTATHRVVHDGLGVAEDYQQDERRHGQGQRQGAGQASRAEHDQDGHDGFGGVGVAADRVRSEDRQGPHLVQPFVDFHAAGEGLADEVALNQFDTHL